MMPAQPPQSNMPQSSLSPGPQGLMPPGQMFDDKKKKPQARKRVSFTESVSYELKLLKFQRP